MIARLHPAVARQAGAAAAVRGGFSLVELLVSVAIIAILASLMLTGLAAARRRGKADKSRSTIRKLHELVMPQYEGYLRRRVPFARSTNARQNAINKLVATRRLMLREMPDQWADVFPTLAAMPIPADDPLVQTAVIRAYAAYRETALPTPEWGNAECLHMIVARSSVDPDALEHFRSDEVGDTDGDGAPEFLDGWGRPIVFLRWAPGFVFPNSAVQFADPEKHHDPFDPQRVDAVGYSLVPLIVSPGADGLVGLYFTLENGWQQYLPNPGLRSIVGLTDPVLGSVAGISETSDNITNHELSR